MSSDFKKTEEWITRANKERCAAPNGGLCWGKVIWNGKLINLYTNKDFINYIFTQPIAPTLPENKTCMIADFGAGNGYVAQTVVSQLEQPCVIPIGIDRYHPDLKVMKQEKCLVQPIVKPVQGDLRKRPLKENFLPFKKNTFHAGIFRFALSFIGKNFQPQVFKQISRVMKPSAVLVVLNYGVFEENEKNVDAHDILYAKGSAASGRWTFENLKKNMHDPSCEHLIDMAEEAGFEVKAKTDLTDIALGYTSPEIYKKLYRLNSDQHEKLKAVFEKCKEKGVLPFEPDSLRVLRPMYSCVLKKKAPSPSP